MALQPMKRRTVDERASRAALRMVRIEPGDLVGGKHRHVDAARIDRHKVSVSNDRKRLIGGSWARARTRFSIRMPQRPGRYRPARSVIMPGAASLRIDRGTPGNRLRPFVHVHEVARHAGTVAVIGTSCQIGPRASASVRRWEGPRNTARDSAICL